MKRIKIAFLILCSALLGSIPAISGQVVVVNLESVPNPWADVRLGEKLDFYLATESRTDVIRISPELRDSLNWDTRTERLDDLIDHGIKMNARYLVDVFIDRIDLDRRKVTVVPQAAFRYRVYGVLSGMLRVIDIERARMVRVKEIDCEIKVSDRWRFGDDDINDADLHLSAYRKTIMFDELEEKAAQKIFGEISRLTRGTGSFVKNIEDF